VKFPARLVDHALSGQPRAGALKDRLAATGVRRAIRVADLLPRTAW